MNVIVVTHSYGLNGAAALLKRTLGYWVNDLDWSVDALLDPGVHTDWREDLNRLGIVCVKSCDPARYDFVLINTFIDIQWIDPFFGRLPIVFWVHDGLSIMHTTQLSDERLIDLFGKPDVLIFQTAWQPQAVFGRVLKEVPPERIVCIPCGVEGLERSGTKPISEVTRIVSLGSVYGRKRPMDLAEAVIQLATDSPVHCTFVGDLTHANSLGPRFKEIRTQYPALLTWTGGVSEQEKIERLEAADIACFPSGDETFGISAIEAASLALPIVLADLPVYASVGWVHESNCLLYPAGNVAALKTCLSRLIEDPALRQTLGQAAQAFSRRFDMAEFLQTMTRTVEKTLSHTPPPI